MSSLEHTSRLHIRPMVRSWSFPKFVPSRRSISVVGYHQGADRTAKVFACRLTTCQKEMVSRNLSWHLKVRLSRETPFVSCAMNLITLMSESQDREAATSKRSSEGRAFIEQSYKHVNTGNFLGGIHTSNTPVRTRDKLVR
jgi:hypothetical protein